MDISIQKYQRSDWFIAVILSVVMLIVSGSQLTLGMTNWGDDFAAYLSEGISISNNTFEEQVKKNYFMHPSHLSEDADGDSLVYVWGYPLALSLIHQIVGFDTTLYNDIIYYKLPSCFAFSLMIGILYLLYRRRFSISLSVFLSLIFAASGSVLSTVEAMFADTYFLFFCILSFWLSECYFDTYLHSKNRLRFFVISILLGIALWMTYETRLNGQTVIIIICIGHILHIIKSKPKFDIGKAILTILPYVSFFVLKTVSESILLPATPNTSDIGNLTGRNILWNIAYYFELTITYINGLYGPVNLHLWPILCVLFAFGFFSKGFGFKNLPYTGLIIGTYIVLILLPYIQGLRYMFNILPFLLMYIAYGGQRIFHWLSKRIKTNYSKPIIIFFAIITLGIAYSDIVDNSIHNIQNDRTGTETNVYSSQAIDMYHYISSNTDQEDVIAFYKPRALYLNTNRLCFRPNINSHTIHEADYYLHCHYVDYTEPDSSILVDHNNILDLVYQNDLFSLYRVGMK